MSEEVKEKRYNGLAIASMVLGIFTILCGSWTGLGIISGIVGLILGIVAVVQIKETEEKGNGMAIAGIIMNGIMFVVTILVVIIFGAAIVAMLAGAAGTSM